MPGRDDHPAAFSGSDLIEMASAAMHARAAGDTTAQREAIRQLVHPGAPGVLSDATVFWAGVVAAFNAEAEAHGHEVLLMPAAGLVAASDPRALFFPLVAAVTAGDDEAAHRIVDGLRCSHGFPTHAGFDLAATALSLAARVTQLRATGSYRDRVAAMPTVTDNALNLFEARCPCGWVSTDVATPAEATSELQAHLAGSCSWSPTPLDQRKAGD